MRIRCRDTIIVVATAALITSLFVTLAPSLGQERTYRAPRLPGTSQPNLNGIWQALNTANWDIEGGPAQAGPLSNLLGAYTAQPAGLSVVEGGQIPYQPWALAKKKENFEKRLTVEGATPDGLMSLGDPELKCFMPGVPRATYMPYPFQIVQSASGRTIGISYEFASAVRVINMTNHEEAAIDSWMGWSNGRWDRDTLVVDVTGLNGYSWFDRAGNFQSNTLHVIERYTPTGPDHLMYEATIEDPKVYTRPWKITMPLYRRLDKNLQLLEFKCVEFVEELMLGKYRKQPSE